MRHNFQTAKTLFVICLLALTAALVCFAAPSSVIAMDTAAEQADMASVSADVTGEITIIEQGTCGENLTWTLDDKGTLTISGTGPMYDYTYYSNYTPWRSLSIENVVINDGVTSIGEYAFYLHSEIKTVTIGLDVTTINYNAFSQSGIENVTILSPAIIKTHSFTDCYYLKNIVLGSNVKAIESEAFSSEALQSVTINGAENVGKGAFKNCSSLKSITIGADVKSIEEGAFYELSALESINVDAANPYYCSQDGILFNKAKTTLVAYPRKKTNAIYTVPSTVTRISDYAFYNASSLESVTISDSVVTIGQSAFYECPLLVTVKIGNGVQDIGDYAFYYCEKLVKLTIGQSLKTIGDYAFYRCVDLNRVVLPNTTTSIGEHAFASCSILKEIIIPENVTDIGASAFSQSGLTSIIIPDSVINLGEYAFGYCKDLTSAVIGNGITRIEANMFQGCTALESVTIGNNVLRIDSGAFLATEKLTTLVMGENISLIESGAFSSSGLSKGDVYYSGSEEDWGYINIESNNAPLLNATKHYNYVPDPGDTVVMGDVNGDGEIDYNDAIILLRYDSGLTTLDADALKAADTNGDGEADYADAILILKYDSGLISSFN